MVQVVGTEIHEFEDGAIYNVGTIVRYKGYYCTIMKTITSDEFKRQWQTRDQSYLVTSSIGDPGPEDEIGIDDTNHNTGLLFKLSTANKDDLPKIIIENRKQ